MLKLEKYSIGVGDRFGQQAPAQLRACIQSRTQQVTVIPVWNKSFREHSIIGSNHAQVKAAAEAAVKALNWDLPWHVDADHIRLDTVDGFIPNSDFFTLDVAESIGKPAPQTQVEEFMKRHPELNSKIQIEGIDRPLNLDIDAIRRIATKYLTAVKEAGAIYQYIRRKKGDDNFIIEMSTDEADVPQTPEELLVILAAVADEQIPIQTIAPRFSGRFNKGVDYVGDIKVFAREFEEDIGVIKFAIKRYNLPQNLKLSVHSGSDKFSIYEPIRRAIRKHGVGLHIKTAGTTWLEEVIGLAEAGGPALELVKEIYIEAVGKIEELTRPYATVIDIHIEELPPPEKVKHWSSEQFVLALRHQPNCPQFNPSMRQLMHVAYKLAAARLEKYLALVREHESIISRNVTQNLYDRHIKPIFID